LEERLQSLNKDAQNNKKLLNKIESKIENSNNKEEKNEDFYVNNDGGEKDLNENSKKVFCLKLFYFFNFIFRLIDILLLLIPFNFVLSKIIHYRTMLLAMFRFLLMFMETQKSRNIILKNFLQIF